MPISFACPHCRKKVAAPSASAGKRVSCPACNLSLRVPDEDELPFARTATYEEPSPVQPAPMRVAKIGRRDESLTEGGVADRPDGRRGPSQWLIGVVTAMIVVVAGLGIAGGVYIAVRPAGDASPTGQVSQGASGASQKSPRDVAESNRVRLLRAIEKTSSSRPALADRNLALMALSSGEEEELARALEPTRERGLIFPPVSGANRTEVVTVRGKIVSVEYEVEPLPQPGRIMSIDQASRELQAAALAGPQTKRILVAYHED